ncbi:MAG: S46 family peptidase [Planctomycetota bacterium]
MAHQLFARVLVPSLLFTLLPAARADEGMWLFTRPPAKELKERHGVELSAEWLEHVQKSAVRLGSGGSASLVSPNGLVMTNHHVGRDTLQKLSTAERNLIDEGFYAPTREQELKCPDLEANILWSIEDVTERVQSSAKPGATDAEVNDARRETIAKIEDESKSKTGLKSEVVTLYQGGRYHLYRYKRFTDLRLVMAPEHGIAFFGGDPDNFEYPRYNLDVCFFRIYEEGKPLQTEHYLKWARQGATDNELVFVAGHPGRTERLFTVDHLEFLRDVSYPLIMRNLWRREVQLDTFSGRSAENRRIAESDFFSAQNSRKVRTGILGGLQDPQLMKEKAAAEAQLRAAVDANPEWKKKWGDAWDQIARAERSLAEFYPRMTAMGGSTLGLGGRLFGAAKDLVRMADEKEKPSATRLREYTDSSLPTVELRLFSKAPIYPALEIEKMTASLQLMCELLGSDDPIVVTALAGKAPRARAEELVRGTQLADVETRKKLAAGGVATIKSSSDPMIQLVRALDPESRKLRKRYEDEVESAEREGYRKIAAAQFALYGEDLYPDATFTLRLSYGTVKSYVEGGETVAPFTNFAGLYERSAQRDDQYPFQLPARWAKAKDLINLNTPFNFVSTCDIIGGNSGSPVINKAGEVVGLIFDGNIQSTVGNIAYTDEQARAVSVDARGIIEALRKIYDAGALADEITGSAAASQIGG